MGPIGITEAYEQQQEDTLNDNDIRHIYISNNLYLYMMEDLVDYVI